MKALRLLALVWFGALVVVLSVVLAVVIGLEAWR